MPALKRSITYPLLTLYGLGTILGAGIYVLIGKVALVSGLYAPVAFIVAAALAGVSGYSYAALSSRYPQSAGEAVYVQAAFGYKWLSALVGWMVLLTGIVSAATITNGFVGYLNVFIEVGEFTAITIVIIGLCALACWGVSQSVTVAAVVTALEVAGLMLVLALAGDALLTLPDRWQELTPQLSDSGAWFAILLGAFIAFYAFIGFEDMVNMAEEVKSPETNLPKAIITALLISAVLYLLIALVAILTLPLAELQDSDAPMKDILKQHSAEAAVAISLISLVAVINGALVQIIMGARVLYGMGRQGLAPKQFSLVHKTLQTPVFATVLVTTVVWLFAIALPLLTLAKLTSFIILVVFLFINLALIKVLRREKVAKANDQQYESLNSMSISVWVPLLGALMCMLFLAIQLFQLLTQELITSH